MSEFKPDFNPFPGLRPFEFHEAYLFFGREGQSDELLRRLQRTRFLAIVGTSGSGKSSLVRAGMLPALYSGFMTKAGSSWRIAIFRPGNDPIGNMAGALNTPEVFGAADENAGIRAAMTEATLRRSGLGLVDVVRYARMPAHENLLVIVDQFEELFRFKQTFKSEHPEDEAAAFVKLLLEAAKQNELPIYVVLTMRSDFLGDCAQFRDLPEAINDGQYLIPRMTRDQRRAAITGPVFVGGGEIAERLVQRLLNDVGDNPDQLPILQHALMRTWDYWAQRHKDGEPLDLRHYEAIGTMEKALSLHADEAYNELFDARRKHIAEKLFKCLTEKGPDNREIRRPTKLQEVCAVAEAGEQEVIAVVDIFRREGRTFIMPPSDVELHADSLLDISHESLIRNWERLKKWVKEEAQSAQIYRRLAETATLYQQGKAGLWRDPDLGLSLQWLEEEKPNAAWANRYHMGFNQVITFIKNSRNERDQEIQNKEREREERERLLYEKAELAEKQAKQQRKALRQILTFAAILFVALLSSLGFWWRANNLAQLQRSSLYWSKAIYAIQNDDLVRAAHFFARSAEIAKDTMQIKNCIINIQRILVSKGIQDRLRVGDIMPHGGAINGATFSPDGSLILSWSEDSTAQLWRAKDGSRASQPMRHDGSVSGATFSRDGRLILSWSKEDSTTRLWNTEIHSPVDTMKHHGPVNWATFSRDGHLILTWSVDNTVRVWNLKGSLQVGQPIQHNGSIKSGTFSPDSSLILTWNVDGAVEWWDAKDASLVKGPVRHSNFVKGATFSPDGSLVLTWSADTVQLWNFKGDSLIGKPMRHKGIEGACFSPNGSLILTWNKFGTMQLWNPQYCSTIGPLMKDGTDFNSATFSKDGRLILTSSYNNRARLWHVKDGSPSVLPIEHDCDVRGAIFNSNGSLILTWDCKGKLHLWNNDADYDFPKEHLRLLVEFFTNTTMNDEENLSQLKSEKWQKKCDKFVKNAKQHLEDCQYKNANLYHRRQQFYENGKQ